MLHRVRPTADLGTRRGRWPVTARMLKSMELPKLSIPLKFEVMAVEQLEQDLLSSLTDVTPNAIVRLLYQSYIVGEAWQARPSRCMRPQVRENE